MKRMEPKLEWLAPAELKPYAKNPKKHPPEQIASLAASIKEFGWTRPLLADEKGLILAGHGAWQAAQEAKLKRISCIRILGLSPAQKRAYCIADNRLSELGRWNPELLKLELSSLKGFNLAAIGFSEADLSQLLKPAGYGGAGAAAGALAERFMIPPFSVLNAREGWWQSRKRAWLALGIQSELGRGENLLKFSPQAQLKKRVVPGGGGGKGGYSQRGRSLPQDGSVQQYLKQGSRATQAAMAAAAERLELDGGTTGTSIFDPVLAELLYRWFSPPAGRIFDPFAGGSVRGIVAAKLSRSYLGIDLSKAQIEANEAQLPIIGKGEPRPRWKCGDAMKLEELASGEKPFDFILSCPPYADLERYSDDPRDLSTMSWEGFKTHYRRIIEKSCERLAPDRFAAFVVAQVRDERGHYRDLVGETIAAFGAGGCLLYNEAILITALGSLPIRIGKQFGRYRKLGKTHQNVLIFLKGDAGRATKALGEVEVALPLEGEQTEFGERLAIGGEIK